MRYPFFGESFFFVFFFSRGLPLLFAASIRRRRAVKTEVYVSVQTTVGGGGGRGGGATYRTPYPGTAYRRTGTNKSEQTLLVGSVSSLSLLSSLEETTGRERYVSRLPLVLPAVAVRSLEEAFAFGPADLSGGTRDPPRRKTDERDRRSLSFLLPGRALLFRRFLPPERGSRTSPRGTEDGPLPPCRCRGPRVESYRTRRCEKKKRGKKEGKKESMSTRAESEG